MSSLAPEEDSEPQPRQEQDSIASQVSDADNHNPIQDDDDDDDDDDLPCQGPDGSHAVGKLWTSLEPEDADDGDDDDESSSMLTRLLAKYPPSHTEEEDDRGAMVYLCHAPDATSVARATAWFLRDVCGIAVFLSSEPATINGASSSSRDKDDDSSCVSSPQEQRLAAAMRCTHALVLLSPAFIQTATAVQELNTFLARQRHAHQSQLANDDEISKTTPPPLFDVLPVLYHPSHDGNNQASDPWSLFPPAIMEWISSQPINKAAAKHESRITMKPPAFLTHTLWPHVVPWLHLSYPSASSPAILLAHLVSYIRRLGEATDQKQQQQQVQDESTWMATFALQHGIPWLGGPSLAATPESDDKKPSPSRPKTENDDDDDASSDNEDCMIGGVAFCFSRDNNQDTDKDGNDNAKDATHPCEPTELPWKEQVKQQEEALKDHFDAMATYSKVWYGRNVKTLPRGGDDLDDALGAAVLQYTWLSSFASHGFDMEHDLMVLGKSLVAHLQQASNGVDEHDLDHVTVVTAWNGYLLVEAPNRILEKISQLVMQQASSKLSSTEIVTFGAMAPTFAVRAALKKPLDIAKDASSHQVVLWEENGMHILSPASLRAMESLSTGGIPLKDCEVDSQVSLSAMVSVFEHSTSRPATQVSSNGTIGETHNVDAAQALHILAKSASGQDNPENRPPFANSDSEIANHAASKETQSSQGMSPTQVLEAGLGAGGAGGLHILAAFATEHLGSGEPEIEDEEKKPSYAARVAPTKPSESTTFQLIQEWHIVILSDGARGKRTTRATRLLRGIKAQFKQGYYGKMATDWVDEAISELHERLSVLFPAVADVGRVLVDAEFPGHINTEVRYGFRSPRSWSPDDEGHFFYDTDDATETLTSFLTSSDSVKPPKPRRIPKPLPKVSYAVSYNSNEVLGAARNESEPASNSDSDEPDFSSSFSRATRIVRPTAAKRKITSDDVESFPQHKSGQLNRNGKAKSGLDWIAEIAQASAVGPDLSLVRRPEVKTSGRKKKRVRKNYDPKPEERVYITLTDGDVGLGRGGALNRHPGNLKFHQAKLKLQPRYHEALKDERTVIAQELVDSVLNWGGRFLKKDDKGWYVVDNHTARTKCSQALRELYTAEERAAKRQRYRQRKSGEKV